MDNKTKGERVTKKRGIKRKNYGYHAGQWNMGNKRKRIGYTWYEKWDLAIAGNCPSFVFTASAGTVYFQGSVGQNLGLGPAFFNGGENLVS